MYARYKNVQKKQFDGHGNEFYMAHIEVLVGIHTTNLITPPDHVSYPIPSERCTSEPILEKVYVVADMSRVYGLGYSRIGTIRGVYASLKEATDAHPNYRPFREGDKKRALLQGWINVDGMAPHRFYDEHLVYLNELKVQERQRLFWSQPTVYQK